MKIIKSATYYKKVMVLCLLIVTAWQCSAQQEKNNAIYSGIPWFDQDGKTVSAHGANMVRANNRFYLFGEIHSDTSNAFAGFSCYSSADLYNWKFESVALALQKTGKLGPNRVGERPKVMKIPLTGEYIMFMHADTLGYKDQFIGYALSKNIEGPYQFKGPVLFNGKPIKKWDMGTFQDTDGTGYLLTHGGLIYQLSSNYQSVTALVNDAITSGFESPTLFKRNNLYYFIGSHLSSWEKNDNYYYTAPALKGPWTSKGLIAPPGTLTWNSQSTFVLPIAGKTDTTFMFMGDRWSFPKQRAAATYVWQPLTFKNDSVSLPQYLQAWTIDPITGKNGVKKLSYDIINGHSTQLSYTGKWIHHTETPVAPTSRSDEPGASVSLTFTGTQAGIFSTMLPDNGYALVKITNRTGKVLSKNVIDLYARNPASTLVYLSRIFVKDRYTITLSVTDERPNWTDKTKRLYGSTGHFISLNHFMIKK